MQNSLPQYTRKTKQSKLKVDFLENKEITASKKGTNLLKSLSIYLPNGYAYWDTFNKCKNS